MVAGGGGICCIFISNTKLVLVLADEELAVRNCFAFALDEDADVEESIDGSAGLLCGRSFVIRAGVLDLASEKLGHMLATAKRAARNKPT